MPSTSRAADNSVFITIDKLFPIFKINPAIGNVHQIHSLPILSLEKILEIEILLLLASMFNEHPGTRTSLICFLNQPFLPHFQFLEI